MRRQVAGAVRTGNDAARNAFRDDDRLAGAQLARLAVDRQEDRAAHDRVDDIELRHGLPRPVAGRPLEQRRVELILSRGRPRQLRFTYQASAGNQTCLEAHDYIDWLIETDGADVFLAYLEGISDPARFRAVADKAAFAGKPLILAKVGRSEAGRRAAASHTGALAHSGAVDDAIFRHHGIMRGEDLDHMLDIAAAFAFCKLPRGNRVAVITGSGGSAVWMSDILSAHGLELPVLEGELQQRLMALLPYAFENANVIRAAIDRNHVKPDAQIAGAREIAFFPPMTGGSR